MTKTTETNEKRVPAITAEVIRDEKGEARGVKFAAPSLNLSRTVMTDALADAIYAEATCHGIKQKLVDAAAISRNPTTGKTADPADKWNAVMRVYNRITDATTPLWNEPREGTGGGTLLLAAMIRLYPGKTSEQLREWLDGKTDEQRAALRNNPKVAEIILAIQSERAKTSGVDTDAMLEELGEVE